MVTTGILKRHLRRRAAAAALAALALVLAGCGDKAEAPAQTECRTSPPVWDRDGDGVSDRVESHPPNTEHSFSALQCDEDPSLAEGFYDRGTLMGGVNLPDKGDGYRLLRWSGDPPDANDWGTLTLLKCIEAVGRDLAESRVEMSVNHLSKKDGGELRPHREHQNGLEIDVRYMRKDAKGDPLDLRQDHEAYDPEFTRFLFRSFFDKCDVRVIYADKTMLAFELDDPIDEQRVEERDGTSSHFLVRLNNPSEQL